MSDKLLIICGPTSTGKTALAIDLAKKFDGELISADSRQVYKGMDIGTGKFTKNSKWKMVDGKWMADNVPIYLYDVVDPYEQFSAADFYRLSSKAIENIWQRVKLPILVGGTGLYIKVALEGLGTLGIPADLKIRQGLEKLDLNQLRNRLRDVDPKKAKSMNQSDWSNPRRLIRAVEIAISKKEKAISKLKQKTDYDVLKIGLTATKEVLFQRVDQSLKSRLEQGMVEEVKELVKSGVSYQRLEDFGLEYRFIGRYLRGEIAKETMENQLRNEIHRFVKRQLTWFKKDNQIIWFDISNKKFPEIVEAQVTKWYK